MPSEPDKMTTITADVLAENGQDTVAVTWELPEAAILFLQACLDTQVNMLVIGPVGTGKTSLINALSSRIRNDLRLITVERQAGYLLASEHVLALAIDHMLPTASLLHLRPDRVFVGNIEPADMPELVSLGLGIPLCATLRVPDDGDAVQQLIAHLEKQMAGLSRQQAAALIVQLFPLIVRITRDSSDQPHIAEVSEQTPTERRALFALKDGHLQPTGLQPAFMDRLARFGYGIESSDSFGFAD